MDLEEIYAQFVELLPAVLKNLKQVGKLNAKFMEMIAYDSETHQKATGTKTFCNICIYLSFMERHHNW